MVAVRDEVLPNLADDVEFPLRASNMLFRAYLILSKRLLTLPKLVSSFPEVTPSA